MAGVYIHVQIFVLTTTTTWFQAIWDAISMWWWIKWDGNHVTVRNLLCSREFKHIRVFWMDFCQLVSISFPPPKPPPRTHIEQIVMLTLDKPSSTQRHSQIVVSYCLYVIRNSNSYFTWMAQIRPKTYLSLCANQWICAQWIELANVELNEKAIFAHLNINHFFSPISLKKDI